MSKKPGSVTPKKPPRNAFNRINAKQSIADREASPEFQANYERLRAERKAREQAEKALNQDALGSKADIRAVCLKSPSGGSRCGGGGGSPSFG